MGKLLGIYPSEWKRVLIFFSLNFILSIGITMGSTAALSLFIVRYGVEHLPVVFILTAFFTLFVMAVYGNFIGRMSNENLFLTIMGLNSAAILAMWRLVGAGFSPVFLLLYPGYSIITALTYNHVFVIIYDYFDARESKRLLPLIASGVSLGGIVGGFGVKAALSLTGTDNLLLVWVACMALAAGVVAAIRVLDVEGVEKKQAGRKKSSLGFFAMFMSNYHSVMRFPLVRTLIFSTAAITVAFFISDFLANKVFAARFPDEVALTSFLGVFAGVASLVGLILQVGALPRLLGALGVGGANFIYPGFMFAGLASLLAWPALPSACLGYFNRKFLAYSVGDPVERLLYNALPSQMKGRASSFIKGYVLPLSTAAASVFILAVNAVFGGNAKTAFAVLAAFGFAASLVNIYQRRVLKRLYAASLVSLLKDRNIDLEALAADWTKDTGENIPVEEYLESPDDAMYALTLEFIREMKLARYAPKLREVFHGRSLEMKRETLKTLAEVDGAGQADFLLELAGGEAPELRALAIRLLGGLGCAAALDKLARFIDDADAKIQAAAMSVILSHGSEENVARAKSPLLRMLGSRDDGEFIRGVEILEDTGAREHIGALAALLEGKKGAARERAIKAICRLENGADERYLKLYHELLKSDGGAAQGWVIEALGRVAAAESAEVLFDEMERMTVTNRIKAVRAMGAIGRPALECLVSILGDTTRIQPVRIECMAQLDGFPADATRKALDEAGKREIEFVYLMVQLRMKLAEVKGRNGLLDFVVDEMVCLNVGVWLNIIARKAKKTSDVVMLIEPLLGASRAACADSLETLESLTDKASSGLVSPLFDQVPDRQRLAAAGKFVAIEDIPLFELYERVMRRVPVEHAACMLFAFDSVFGDRTLDRVAGVVQDALCSGKTEMLEAALLAAGRNGVAWRLREMIEPYENSENGCLRAAARVTLNRNLEGDVGMLSTFEKIMFLKNVETFAGLDTHALRVLSGISSEVEYSNGDIIFEEGDQGDAMYVIHKGSVRLFLEKRGGGPLAVLGEAAYFGEMAVLDGEPRSAGAAAEADCRLIRIQRDHFIELIHEYPMITIPIFQALSRRLRAAQK